MASINCHHISTVHMYTSGGGGGRRRAPTARGRRGGERADYNPWPRIRVHTAPTYAYSRSAGLFLLPQATRYCIGDAVPSVSRMSELTRRLTTLTRHVAPHSSASLPACAVHAVDVAPAAGGAAKTAFITAAAAAVGAAIAWSYDKTGYPRAPLSAVPVPGSPDAAAAEFEEEEKSAERTQEQSPFVLLAHVKVHEELLAEHMEYAETIDGIVRDSEPGMLYHSLDQYVHHLVAHQPYAPATLHASCRCCTHAHQNSARAGRYHAGIQPTSVAIPGPRSIRTTRPC